MHNEPKQSAHTVLSPPHTADENERQQSKPQAAAAKFQHNKKTITFAQVHYFAAVGHAVAALARAVGASTKAACINNLAAVWNTVTPHASDMIAKANSTRIQGRIGTRSRNRHGMPKPKRNRGEISANASRNNVRAHSFENIAEPKLTINILPKGIQHSTFAIT